MSIETKDLRGEPRPFRVSGIVRFADGIPASRTRVIAVDRDLRSEQPLGEAVSDRDGAYLIDYAEIAFLNGERASADLLVRAIDGNGAILAASPVLFNAPRRATVDLTIALDRQLPPTLFDRIASALKPLLGRVPVEELEEDQQLQDLTFLAGESGFDKRALARFVLAHRLAKRGIAPEFWFALQGGPFVEVAETDSLALQLAALSAALPTLDAIAVGKALASSFNRREIAAALEPRTAEWIAAFLDQVAAAVLGDANAPTFVRMALADAGIDSVARQATFARLFIEHHALTPELLEALASDGSFKEPEIADLRTSYGLADLTQAPFSVVKMLKEAFQVRRPEQIHTIAKRSEREWIELVVRRHEAGTIDLPAGMDQPLEAVRLPEAQLYALTLERQFREAFPTAAFAGALQRAAADGGAHGIRHAEALGVLIERQPDFDLLHTPVDEFLDRQDAQLGTLVRDEAFRLELKAVQRVFKLAPTFAATDALLADGIHSAQMIYRIGESEFVRRYAGRAGLSADSARLAWNRAADTHAAVLTVIGDMASFDSGVLPGILSSSHPDLATFPNWENLFQSGDICHCEQCRSVLSPAAYFTDILMFLRDRNSSKPKPGGGFASAKDILFGRRPDLGFLELNCDNALTTLPYVDVVCEVLERATDAAAANDLRLTGFSAIPAAPAASKGAVAAALAAALADPVNAGKEKIALEGDFSLSQVDPGDPDRWVVHGDNVTYLLKKKAGPDFFAERIPNTKADSAQLRAYPAYVNPQAYRHLRAARFPLALPFDLFGEEVSAAFQKSGLQRWDLMRTLRGPAAPNNPTDGEIAAQYFGIGVDAGAAIDEKRMILVADATLAGQQEAWGEQGNAGWLALRGYPPSAPATVANVKTFLAKSGLGHDELLALLDLPFINPAGDIVIRHLDSSCDTGMQVIQGLNPAKLDRMHRFLRLWRKLAGWKMWELDLVIGCKGIGNGALDEAFLVNLHWFGRLRTRLGAKASVEQLCALFDDLGTASHFTRVHEKRADGLYAQLFLNRKLIQPLDADFAIDAVLLAPPTTQRISGHRAPILAALGIGEGDLDVLAGLVRPAGAAYITDDLTLANLSFLWRHAWLAKLLKLKVAEWPLVLKVLQQDVPRFAGPADALAFIEQADQLRATGFTPDELNWLLAADRSARAAVKEADAARFLASLRAGLQAVRAEFDPARYEFMASPADPERLAALLATLLPQLKRDEAAAQFFVDTLKDDIAQQQLVAGLPAAFAMPATITGAPHHIRIRYEPVLRLTAPLTPAQRAVLQGDPTLAAVTALASYQQALLDLANKPGAAAVHGLPPGFAFPPAITGAPNNIPIRYEPVLRFTGLMTAAQQTVLTSDATLAAVTGIAAYQQAIGEFFRAPRLALKFLDPVFSVPLASLPAAVDFKAVPAAAGSASVVYDAELRVLRVAGILSQDDKLALDKLSADLDYRNAVNSLFTQPVLGAFGADQLWLQDTDLQFPLRDPNRTPGDPAGEDVRNLAANLATAVQKALAYLARTLADDLVIRQASAQVGLTEALTAHLLRDYPVLPETLLAHLTGTFAGGAGVVDYATIKPSFDGLYWALRIAALWKKWKPTLSEVQGIGELGAAAQLVAFADIPIDSAAQMAPIDRLLRASRLFRFKDSVPETGITLFEVLLRLASGAYTAADFSDFAADVARLNEVWSAADVQALAGALDLAFPKDYLLAETWERVTRAFSFVDSLKAGVATVKTFAAATMTDKHANTVKALLRSGLGGEMWLSLSEEIQDVLRERKRDALAAWLLAQPMPADATSGKWENTNDLYAYYLLDVEMGACQLTSRLVQASGSVQLFVQRCFMGLEREVPVQADGANGDSAWNWWKWMRKYRVWEANRKVFLWPENWIEPELKKDRSPFFKDLENDLLQNEVTQDTVEGAFAAYLEKLDGVAQLEIAGFYQEDDADLTIVHVFGRTTGAEPHVYYYRRYDYRQWTPWEKVELDIQGDYLVPAVINKRLFLLWPQFTEVQDEAANNNVDMPSAIGGTTIKPMSGGEMTMDSPPAKPVEVRKAAKKLRMQMCVSDYRSGKWAPKRVSVDFDHTFHSHEAELYKTHYQFFALDRTITDGSFVLKHHGHSVDVLGAMQDAKGTVIAELYGDFDVSGCRAVPGFVSTPPSDDVVHVIRPTRASLGSDSAPPGGGFLNYDSVNAKWREARQRNDVPHNDFTLENQFNMSPLANVLRDAPDPLRLSVILEQTPGLFAVAPPWHLSLLDRWLLDANVVSRKGGNRFAGTWLPFFYQDKARSFFVLPSLGGQQQPSRTPAGEAPGRLYYPEMKRNLRQWEDFFSGQVQAWLDSVNLAALTAVQRHQLEQALQPQFPEMPPPPYADEQLKALWQRALMRFHHLTVGGWALWWFQFRQFHFTNFYHPFVCDFARLVNNPLKGIPALMSRQTQLKDSGFSFHRTYLPTPWVATPFTEQLYPREVVDFDPEGAYSSYNWELFFHAPLLIANALSKNQRFDEARDWYHFIFNPIGVASPVAGGSAMSKYWITKPFFETTDKKYVRQRIENIMQLLAGDPAAPGFSAAARQALEDQVSDWRSHPFEPHRIAAYRTVAYQKTVVMKYMDNLIAWADNLFRQDSMESINEATQLYILAAEIAGERARQVAPQARPPVDSFNELESRLDAYANALVQVENLIPPLPGTITGAADAAPLPMLYFCIPHNEKLLGYWDTIADRLYKIRHCMNIDGVVRQLALFEPPIDPAALVKAVAGGLDIGAALAELNAPLPLYRFNLLLQKANEVCNDVKALGGALMAALEKKDGEALGLLRQGQEIRVQEAVKAVREKQIEEAKENLEGARKSKITVETKRNYYRDIEAVSAQEKLHLDKLSASQELQMAAQGVKLGAAIFSVLPAIDLGISGFGASPVAKAKIGGLELGQAANLASEVLGVLAQIAGNDAAMASSRAGSERRFSDWKLQEHLAERELDQIDRQIAAAELRVAIAEKELDNHVKQIDNAKAIDQFMRSKYTSLELYQWQVGQVSGVYFQSYKLAFDLAKRAERCFRFELGVQDSSFVSFGYWDSLKKGLLSGEKLQYDLRRMESAYLEQNRREFELTRHVSLLQLDPLALLRLRETGRCFFDLREELFDLDYPGHYFRRIKSVSLTLPCVSGPYTTVSCTLRLLKNSIRSNTGNGDGYPRSTDDAGLPADDARFMESNIAGKAIAASSGQNDSGLFELTFRDERYLPFEGAGVISSWSLELFSDAASPDFGRALRQFDYGTISDAVMHIKYSAREDAGQFKNAAIAHLRAYFSEDGATPGMLALDLRRDFASAWSRFLNPGNPANGNVFELELSPAQFPLRDAGKTLMINRAWLFARASGIKYGATLTPPAPAAPIPLSLVAVKTYGGLHMDQAALAVEMVSADPPAAWRIRVDHPGGGLLVDDATTKQKEVEELVLVLGYQWE